jgi:hypothetical protein
MFYGDFCRRKNKAYFGDHVKCPKFLSDFESNLEFLDRCS